MRRASSFSAEDVLEAFADATGGASVLASFWGRERGDLDGVSIIRRKGRPDPRAQFLKRVAALVMVWRASGEDSVRINRTIASRTPFTLRDVFREVSRLEAA